MVSKETQLNEVISSQLHVQVIDAKTKNDVVVSRNRSTGID